MSFLAFTFSLLSRHFRSPDLQVWMGAFVGAVNVSGAGYLGFVASFQPKNANPPSIRQVAAMNIYFFTHLLYSTSFVISSFSILLYSL